MDKYLGKRLDGRYRLDSLIGIGGMAYVYRATDLKENTTVAVKILKDELLENTELVRRFKNESRAIGLLSHENIVKVLDVNYSDSVQYIVMEYLSGITLKEYIDANKPVSWKNAVFISEQLLKALQHAHDRGIIHRDMKPQNVMLSSDGRVKVMDFGIARFSRSPVHTITDKAIGTVHYISPEQAKGEECDARSDIYSLGVMMYEMATGTLPFDGDSAVAVALMQISDEPASPRSINESIPEGLEQIINRAMAKDPDKRYQSAGAMLLDIEEFRKNPSVSFEYRTVSSKKEAEDKPVTFEKEDTRTGTGEFIADKTKSKTFEIPETGEKVISKEIKIKKSDNISAKKKKQAHRNNKKVPALMWLLVSLSVLFMAGAVVLGILTMRAGAGENVQLPDFKGMSIREVQSCSDYSSFNITFNEVYNTEYDAGIIYNQSPAANSTVKESANVTLYVSIGAKLAAVPDLVGKSYSEALELLTAQGFVAVKETTSYTDQKANIITKVEPSEGTSLAVGSPVTVYVNLPSASVTVSVPYVVGMPYTQAEATIRAYGLNVGEIKELYDPDATVGSVLSQSVEANETVSGGTEIDITVCSGNAEKASSFDIKMPYRDPKGNTSYTVTVYDSMGEEITSSEGVTAETGFSLDADGKGEQIVRVAISGYDYITLNVNYTDGTCTTDQDFSSVNGFVVERPVYQMTVSCNTEGGSASASEEVNDADSWTLTITCLEGYKLNSVLDNGENVTDSVVDGKYTLDSVSEKHDVSVRFEKITENG